MGKGIVALPQKLGGGVTLTDLETGKSLASIWYSNYGASSAHHGMRCDGSAWAALALMRFCQVLRLPMGADMSFFIIENGQHIDHHAIWHGAIVSYDA